LNMSMSLAGSLAGWSSLPGEEASIISSVGRSPRGDDLIDLSNCGLVLLRHHAPPPPYRSRCYPYLRNARHKVVGRQRLLEHPFCRRYPSSEQSHYAQCYASGCYEEAALQINSRSCAWWVRSRQGARLCHLRRGVHVTVMDQSLLSRWVQRHSVSRLRNASAIQT
jgi:hypothetical protein